MRSWLKVPECESNFRLAVPPPACQMVNSLVGRLSTIVRERVLRANRPFPMVVGLGRLYFDFSCEAPAIRRRHNTGVSL